MGKRDRCVALRAQGKSFRDIANVLNIPLSTAHLWARQVQLTAEQKTRLADKSLGALQEARLRAQEIKKINYKSRVQENYQLGRGAIGSHLAERELMCVAAALYWAEGFKKDSRLGFANSDPDMIRLFLRWLTEVIKVPKDSIRLRVGINAYFQEKTSEIEDYWSKITNIPKNQFQKPFYQKVALKRLYPNTHNYHGVLRVRANGQNDVFRQILGMVDSLKESSTK